MGPADQGPGQREGRETRRDKEGEGERSGNWKRGTKRESERGRENESPGPTWQTRPGDKMLSWGVTAPTRLEPNPRGVAEASALCASLRDPPSEHATDLLSEKRHRRGGCETVRRAVTAHSQVAARLACATTSLPDDWHRFLL